MSSSGDTLRYRMVVFDFDGTLADSFQFFLEAAHAREEQRHREAVLCIGDELRDIEAAQAENLDAGAVTWGYATPEALARWRPSMVFSSFAEIVSCVKAS